MSSAWIYQDDKQVKKRGEDRASWYVGWVDPEGKRRCKSCGPGLEGQRNAEKLRKKIEAQLLAGTYKSNDRATWEEFRAEYDAKILDGLDAANRNETRAALRQFERLVRPKRMATITTATLAGFVAARRKEPGKRPGTTLSPATANKEVRHLRAVLRKAHKWGYLPRGLPEFEFLREPKKLPTYMPPDHFAKVYQACEAAARWPEGLAYSPGEWWRALLMTAYMTGWRIGQLMALRRDEVDLDAGTAFGRAEDNKGKRDVQIVLHPVVIDHLRRLPGFAPVFFPWNHARRRIFEEFGRVQRAAGVKPDRKVRYGFHDLRRAFATMNADRLTADALQAMMQHQDYQTTQRYINMARQMKPAAHNLFVPDVSPRAAEDGEAG